MIKAKPKSKRRNPKTFKEAILETVDDNITLYENVKEDYKNDDYDYNASVILDILKIVKQKFKKENDNYFTYSLIRSMGEIFEKLKKDVNLYYEG